MSTKPEAIRLIEQRPNIGEWKALDRWSTKACDELRRLAGIELDYARLLEKHNALHISARASRDECDRLRADRDSWQEQASDRVDDAVRFAGERDAAQALAADRLAQMQADRAEALRWRDKLRASVPLSAIRPIAVEAIREATGAPDITGRNGGSLVEELERTAQACADTLRKTGDHA